MRECFYKIYFTLLFLVLSTSLIIGQSVVQSWDFETALGDWASGSGSASLELSTEQYHGGAQSVKMVQTNTSTEINLQNDVYKPENGDSLNCWVYIAADDLDEVDGVQIFWQTNSWATWNNKWIAGTTLQADAWNEIGATLTGLDAGLQRIGIQFTGKAGTADSTPTMYVDDISVIRAETPAEDFIVVDGEKDDFYNTLTGPDDGFLQLRYFHGNDNGVAYSNNDLSANIWTAWDTTWFYFYAEVKDDTISGSGANSYQDDGLELKIDPVPTAAANSIFAPNLTILGGTGSDSLNTIADSMKQWVRKQVEGGYVLELAIKWAVIVSGAESISAAVDSVFGLAINIHDNDHPVSGTREHSIQWAAVMLDAVWNTPANHGTVKFLADNKLQFIPINNFTPANINPLPYDGTDFYVNVDGQRDRVFNALRGPGDGYLQIRSFASSDNGTPESDADLSAMVWANWDTTWFYLYTEVRDDSITNGTTTNVWEVDNLEIKFDPQATDSTQSGTGSGSPSIFDTRLSAPFSGAPGDSLNNITDENKKWARRVTANGYALELAIKWAAVMSSNSETVSVGVDSVFGLAINIHDNDSTARVASIVWAAFNLDALWQIPKYFGTVTFLEDNKFNFNPVNNMTGATNHNYPYDGSILVGVDDYDNFVPDAFELAQNFPNPFNPSTRIYYNLNSTSKVNLSVYDILGRQVAVLVNEIQNSGKHEVLFNASNLASGIYFYKLQSNSGIITKKMMLLK